MVLSGAVNPLARALLIALVVVSICLKAPLGALAQDTTSLKNRGFRGVSNDFSTPVSITVDPRDKATIIVAERSGLISSLNTQTGKTAEVVDIEELIGESSPRGILSVTASGSNKNYPLFVNYLDPQGDLVVGRFTLPTTPTQLNPESMTVVIKIARITINSLGSGMDLGPDGTLYIGTNDGEGKSSTRTPTAQMPQNLLGKILRIKPGERIGYSVPEDNPFKINPNFNQQRWQPEIWSLGFRNPEALHLDSVTRKLVVLDSSERTEEINLVESAKNYGWDKQDGAECLVKDCSNHSFIRPITTRPKSSTTSHLVGGIPYHRDLYPELRDTIIFAETTSGTLYSTNMSNDTNSDSTPNREPKIVLQLAKGTITALGEGHNGEIYIATDRGEILELQH